MRAQLFFSAVGSLCLAAGTATAHPPAVPPGLPPAPPASPFVPSPTGPQQLLPFNTGYGTLPQQGLPVLQAPPGDRMGLEAYAGPGPQEHGAMLGTQPGQVPGIPQAWAMSMWNPAPCYIIKAEVMFLRADFNQARTVPIDGATFGGNNRLAVQ